MCGIAGILSTRHGTQVAEEAVVALRDAQRHRGPDDDGLWLSDDRRIGFGHRRLSIVDLSEAGRQPMRTRDGALTIVFNGEIYNYPQLVAELEALGHPFSSSSDTEVILHGYRQWGLGVLDRLRGMFALALHDRDRGDTLLARDPLGIKPLYYAEGGGTFAFASEVQALRAGFDDGGIDPEALASYLQWGSIAPPRTLYRGIRALPAGHWMRVGPKGAAAPEAYYRLEDDLGHTDAMTPEEAFEAVRAALVDSARHHLVADVPVGAFLSGGVDSSALVGLLSEAQGASIQTINLAFDVPELDESALARQAADVYGAQHHEIPIRIDQIRERLPDAVRALDQPSIDGINTFFVSEAAAKAGLKVAVSGVGGDELFGGYASFERVPRIRSAHARIAAFPGGAGLQRSLGRALGRFTRSPVAGKIARSLEFGGCDAGAYYAERGIFSPDEVRSLLAPELAESVERCEPRAALAERVDLESLPEDERVSALELRQYLQVQLLRDTDAMGMRHSLEIRTPLVDRDLLRAVVRVPAALRRAGPAKRGLREAPRPPVPEALWRRRKQGFTLPFEAWLRGGGIPLDLPQHPWLAPSAVEAVARDFRAGRVHWSRLWSLLVLRPFLA
jgi:asparagine synthase (glutamine-hydrolysing)